MIAPTTDDGLPRSCAAAAGARRAGAAVGPASIFSPLALSRADLRGRKVTVMGLGLFGGGRGLTEFLARAGADVLVTDLRDEKTLRPSIEALDGLRVRWVLGRHREEDFLDADAVFVNPAVPRDHALLAAAHRKGVHLDTEMNLFLKLAPGRICAITGSNGKTTTTSLAAAMLRASAPSTRLGGNLGVSLLGEIDAMRPEDWTVLELSSFQLEDMVAIDRRPDVALVTNLSPNHLNRHGTYADYLAAKRVILEGEGDAILNGDDGVVRGWAAATRRAVTYYGRTGTVRPRAAGVWVADDAVEHSRDGERTTLFESGDLKLLGRFNLINAAGAAAAALRCGADAAAVRAGARAFAPIEHRLEPAGEIDGVRFYNDSIATTPESTLCAIEALGPDVVLILGGSDKGSSFAALGRGVVLRSRGAVLVGLTAPRILEAIRAARRPLPIRQAETFEAAVAAAFDLARPTASRVVLSPACASFDMFTHFAARGRRFKEIVAAMKAAAARSRA